MTFSRFGMMASLMVLGGCAMVPDSTREVIGYYGTRDWEALQAVDVKGVAQQMTGWVDAFPPPWRGVQLVERDLCLHRNSEDRVVTQSGRVGDVGYRQCPVTAAQHEVGQRLDR